MPDTSSSTDQPPQHTGLPPLGRYRHYKGAEYSVIGFARHSETGERLVLYIPLYGEGECWARPLSMFVESVQCDDDTGKDGGRVPRFRLLKALQEA